MSEILLVFMGALSRLIPHPANFTAIAAVAIYGAVKFQNKNLALLIPTAAMLLSDGIMEILYQTGLTPFQGFHSGMWFVYGAFILISFIGFRIRSSFNLKNLALGTLVASLVFFAVTNFGVWLSGWYGYTLQGLAECFIAAIPFYRNQLLGDLFFTTVFFGADYALRSKSITAKA
jgi:hypothetical protein